MLEYNLYITHYWTFNLYAIFDTTYLIYTTNVTLNTHIFFRLRVHQSFILGDIHVVHRKEIGQGFSVYSLKTGQP